MWDIKALIELIDGDINSNFHLNHVGYKVPNYKKFETTSLTFI